MARYKRLGDILIVEGVITQDQLEEAVALVMSREEKTVKDYKAGKKTAFTFLVGQVMKETKGKANPAIVNEILKKKLDG